MPDLAWTQNAARPRDDIGDIAPIRRASYRHGATHLARTSKPQPIAVEHKTRGTTMDTTSIVTSRPALADGGTGLQGAALAAQARHRPARRHQPAKPPRHRRAILP